MSYRVTLPADLDRRTSMPRKLVDAYQEAVRARQTGNFVVHLRAGKVMGLTFEQKDSYDDLDRQDVVPLG